MTSLAAGSNRVNVQVDHRLYTFNNTYLVLMSLTTVIAERISARQLIQVQFSATSMYVSVITNVISHAQTIVSRLVRNIHYSRLGMHNFRDCASRRREALHARVYSSAGVYQARRR